ncbi:MAG: glutamyl-tRNA reductase, partial [Phycisphaerae bacterium]|nr:glutamyl-tRNA reductase [Phycisphaerae bacterium]
MEISVIGVNHRTAPVDVREKVSLPGDLARRLLQTVRAEKIFEEAMVLDTCNRTEVYFVSNSSEDGAGDTLDHLVAHIAEVKQAPAIAYTSFFYRHDGQSAVGHLFRVAASLDSQIVGEHEILDQIKGAYRTAMEARSARFLINKLMHWALRVGKRVQTETDLGRGTASVPQAAVELARHVFSSLEGKTVMLLGAGQTAESAAVALVRCGAGHVIVANRTLSRAEELAGRLL